MRPALIGANEARARARTLLAAIREGGNEEDAAPSDTAFETVADEVFRRYARNWKLSTLKVNQGYYRNQILAVVQGAPDQRHLRPRRPALVRVAPRNSGGCGSLGSGPVSVIMRQAEIYGYRPEGTNPCTGIKRYRRQGRERFLSTAEVRRLGEVLVRHEADHPQAVTIIRLLLLTGCRTGEIVTLKWTF